MMSFMPSAAEPTRKWQVPIMQHRHFTSPASSGPPRDPAAPFTSAAAAGLALVAGAVRVACDRSCSCGRRA